MRTAGLSADLGSTAPRRGSNLLSGKCLLDTELMEKGAVSNLGILEEFRPAENFDVQIYVPPP